MRARGLRTATGVALAFGLFGFGSAQGARDEDAESKAAPAVLRDTGQPERVIAPRIVPGVVPRIVTAAEMRAIFARESHRTGKLATPGEPRGEEEMNESEEPRLRLGQPSPEAYSPAPAPPNRVQTSYSYTRRITRQWAVPDTLSWSPADCVIAAGTDHVVGCVNSQVEMWTKDGHRVFSVSLGALLGDTAGWVGFFDPKVVYDEGSGRFFLMALNRHPTARQALFDVAVSITGNPTQGWYVYEWRDELDGEGIDYEELGFGPRALYICGNYISFPGWAGNPAVDHASSLRVLDKATMLAGQGTTSWIFNDIQGSASAAITTPKVASISFQFSGGPDDFMVAFQHMTSPANTLRVSVYGFTLPGNFPTGAPTYNRQEVDYVDHADPPNATQKGGSGLLVTNNLGSAPLACKFSSNTLFIPTHATDGTRSRVRVLSIGIAAWPIGFLNLEWSLSDGTNALFWPGLAANVYGDVSTLYAWSGANQFAGVQWNTLERDDSGFLPSQLLKGGETYVGNPGTDTSGNVYRWGDYTGVAVDPVEQGFWYYGMYAYNRGSLDAYQWRSYVGYAPRAVFVDRANGGSELGSRAHPWNTLGEGQSDSRIGNDVVIKAGTYPENGLVFFKPMTLLPDGGTVQIGIP